LKKKNIYYWSPHLTEIATSKAVINSAYSINRYSNDYSAKIIDAGGEFKKKIDEIKLKKINLIRLYRFNYISFLPKFGKFLSRLSFCIIFILSFFRLRDLLVKKNPDFLIIHLITSLPIILFNIFNFNTKCILRISGYPYFGKVRLFLWRILLKKIYIVTCPTFATYEYLKSLNIVPIEKLKILYDPIISVNEINNLKNQKKQFNHHNFIIAIGRLTKQKNFIFLISCFREINKNYPDLKLLIFGSGEQKNHMQKKILEYSLKDEIILLPFTKNIYPYLKDANCFVLTSLWEDPGFVLLEAAFCRTFIISSNCPNGPKEIVKKNKAGFVYEMSDKKDFLDKFKLFMSMPDIEKLKYKKNALKTSSKFTLFSHYSELNKILL
jgi:glycosyltransferase involved in cell wall biosynthesis